MLYYLAALNSLVPNAQFSAFGEEYTNVEWCDDRPQPTEAEIQAKIAELQADYDSKQYQRDRAAAYPSWQDQLDKIYHEGLEAWKAEIKAIKDQFPKP